MVDYTRDSYVMLKVKDVLPRYFILLNSYLSKTWLGKGVYNDNRERVSKLLILKIQILDIVLVIILHFTEVRQEK